MFAHLEFVINEILPGGAKMMQHFSRKLVELLLCLAYSAAQAVLKAACERIAPR